VTTAGRIPSIWGVTISQDHHIIGPSAALCSCSFFICASTPCHTRPSLITDFPNYYLSARLAHEGYDTSRMYEWDWLQREKDHRAIDIRVIGLAPITPFSTLVMWPLTGIAPLAAKAHSDTDESGATRSDLLATTIDDWPQLSTNRADLRAKRSARSQPGVRAVSCVSTSASRGAVLAHLHENYVWAPVL
jgi:hypothetical protein